MAQPDLTVKYGGLEIRVPFWVASMSPVSKTHKWAPDEHAKLYEKYADLGAGMIHLPTVYPMDKRHPFDGGARFAPHDAGKGFGTDAIYWVSNAIPQIIYTRPEIKQMLAAVKERMKNKDYYCPIVGSLVGRSMEIEEWIQLAKMLEDGGCDMLEVNLGSSGVLREIHGTKMQLYQSPELCEKILKPIVQAVSIPVVAKAGGELAYPKDIIPMGQAFINAGCKGASAIGGYLGIWPPDIYNEGKGKNLKFIKNDKIAWAALIGPFTRNIVSKFTVALCSNFPQLDFCARGGLIDPEHIVEVIMLGAKAGGLCSGLLWRGWTIIPRTVNFLKQYMEEQGYSKIEDFRGIYLKRMIPFEQLEFLPAVAHVDEALCNNCGICYRNFCSAPSQDGEHAKIDEDLCGGCGTCESVCPQEAIKLKLKEEK